MWFLSKDLLNLPGMPSTPSGLKYKADEGGWCKRKPEGVKGRVYEYHIDSLPPETQKYLRQVEAKKQLTEVIDKFDLQDVLKRRAEEDEQKRLEEQKALNGIDEEYRVKALVRAGLVYEYEQFKTTSQLGKGSNV
ncbi:MAG: DNA-binding protein, partial [Vibrio sp.]|uniref:DNA-binding protein n=1 Tax=Vibrio sp. TaxID=678 RepID=UPI003A8A3DC3